MTPVAADEKWTGWGQETSLEATVLSWKVKGERVDGPSALCSRRVLALRGPFTGLSLLFGAGVWGTDRELRPREVDKSRPLGGEVARGRETAGDGAAGRTRYPGTSRP